MDSTGAPREPELWRKYHRIASSMPNGRVSHLDAVRARLSSQVIHWLTPCPLSSREAPTD